MSWLTQERTLAIGFLYTIPEQATGQEHDGDCSSSLAHIGKVYAELDALSMDIVKLDANSRLLQECFSKSESFGQLLRRKPNYELAVSYTAAANSAFHAPGCCYELTGELYCGHGANAMVAECSIEMHMTKDTEKLEENLLKAWMKLYNFKPHVHRSQKKNVIVRAKPKKQCTVGYGAGTPGVSQQELFGMRISL